MINTNNTAEKNIPVIDIYPNPVRKILNFSIKEDGYSPEMIEFFDMSGKKIFENNYHGNRSPILHINIGEFNPGTYIIKIKTREGDLYRKMVKK